MSAVRPQTQTPPPQGGPVYSADIATARALQAATVQQDAMLRTTAHAFNWWGGPGVIWCLALAWIVARVVRRRAIAEFAFRALEGLAVASAISGITKGFAGRARPSVTPDEPWHFAFARGWTDARYFSLPSGHTTAVFAVAAVVTVMSVRWPAVSRAAAIVAAFSSALLVAFARTYSNQHWLSDVAVGALLGSITGFVIARWHARHPNTAFDRVVLGQ